MRNYSHFITNNNKDKFNNDSVNNKTTKEKIKNIIETRLLKNQNLIAKSIQKREKIKEKFIPKNETFYSYFKAASRHDKKKKNEDKKNDKSAQNTTPFIINLQSFQEKINKTNYLIKNLKQENEMFHKGYQKSLLSEQNDKFNINLITNNRANAIYDLYHKNIFNQSLLLTKKKRIPEYILESLDNNESKEDLKLAEFLKSNFIVGRTDKFPELLNEDPDKYEKKQLRKNIRKMKKEIRALEENLSNYNKNSDIFSEDDLSKDQTKELDEIKRKISLYQNSKEVNKNRQIDFIDNLKAKSTTNVNKKLIILSPEHKGEYKLVTKCDIKNKSLSPIKTNTIFKGYSKTLKMQDFYKNYNKAKEIFNLPRKGRFSIDLINSNFNKNIKKERRQLLKKKLFKNQKYLDSLSSCLDSFSEKKQKEKDIINLYYFMKNGNLMDVRDLILFYKNKYSKEYAPENIIKNLKKNREPYNIVNKMHELDKLNNFVEQKGEKERKNILENVKKLDNQMKTGAIQFVQKILNFNS